MNTRRTRIKHRSRRRGPSKLVVYLFGGLMLTGALGVAAVIGWIVWVATSGPKIEELQPRQLGRNSVIYASDGTRIGFLQARVVRQPVASTEIPDVMREATVAVEDRRFYQHTGVDFEGVVRAAMRNITSGKTVEGGSTLTMQLVRTLYADDERSLKRKIREAKLAEELENVHNGPEGKRWILNQYLNNVPYGTAGGQEVIGVQAAARAYYGKAARDLTLAQAAMLAGLPQAPTDYNPLINPNDAKKRRDDVLGRMEEQGYITAQERDKARAQAIDVKKGGSGYYSTRVEGHVFDYVKQQLIKEYGRATVSRGGLKVYTTIDLKMQRAARKAMADNLGGPGMPAAAIASIDPATGQILAMASSKPYATRKFNLAAQIKRRPGSTFKTMTLMAAVRRGVVPESTTYVSKPINITNSPWGPINVKTYSGQYSGAMNLVKGTLTSDNSVYIQLALDIGPENVKKAAVDMGIKSPLKGYPAESLGGLTYGVTPLEMANAYATIASGGYRNTPTAIKRVVFPKNSPRYPNGKTVDLGHPKRAKTFRNGVTGEVTKILQQNVTSGTGGRAQIQCTSAGKTGTVDDFEDAWYVGFVPRIATSVWVGYEPNPIQMNSQFQGASVAGGTFPAQIWGAYMKQVMKNKPCGKFKSITEPVTASKFNGRYASSGGSGTGDDLGKQDDDTITTPDTVGQEPIKKPSSNGGNSNGNSGNAGNSGNGNAGNGNQGNPGNGNGGNPGPTGGIPPAQQRGPDTQ